MPETVELGPSKNKIGLETIWTHYVWLSSHEDIASDEKLRWLDIFLCRAISELAEIGRNKHGDQRVDPFLLNFCENTGPTGTTVSTRLVSILARELRHLCLCFETYKDVRPLKRYVFEGRGWKILYLLSRVELRNQSDKNWIASLSTTSPSTPHPDLSIKDLVELLLNLFQLATQNQVPITCITRSRPRSAMEYWEDTLQVVRKEDDAMSQVYSLWSDLSTIYSGRRKKPSLKQLATSARRKRVSRSQSQPKNDAMRKKDGFPETSRLRPLLPANLSSLEPHFRSRSTDSETLEAAAAIGGDGNAVLKVACFQNPMDFEYFEKLVRSDDEARFQVEWMTSLRSGVTKTTQLKLDPESSCAPDHATILNLPISETQFCRLICRILVKIADAEIRSRNLKTSYELSLTLTQFSCDELSILAKLTTNAHNQSSRHELRIALVNLALTALAEVQFNEDHLVFLQKNNVLGLCLNVLCDCLSETEPKIQECCLLSASLLNIVRTFHDVSKRTVTNSKMISFAVCNLFGDENGTMAIERTLQLAVTSVIEGKSDGKCLRVLLKEVGKFMNDLGVCEVQLSDVATCSKRTVQCLASLYTALSKLANELQTIPFNQFFEDVLDALDLSNSIPCVHPVVIWDNLLPKVLFQNGQKIEQQKSQIPNCRRKVFNLIEKTVEHMSLIRHPAHTKWRNPKPNGSLSDSDSAFYASDASDNRMEQQHNQSVTPVNSLQHLMPYSRLLSGTFEDIDEPSFNLVKETLRHLTQILCVGTWSTRFDILAAVLVPVLESQLQKLPENSAPKEIELFITQRTFALVEQLLKNKDILNYCHQQRLFIKVFASRQVEGLSNEVYQFVFHFVDQDLRQIMSNAASMESLTVWSGIEVSTDENEHFEASNEFDNKARSKDDSVCHAKTVYRAFTSNATLGDVLAMLETRSEEFVTTDDMTDICLSETLAMWNLQAQLVKSSSDYSSFFIQRDLLYLLNQVSRRCCHLLTSGGGGKTKNITRLIETVGALVELLVQLDLREQEASSLKREHHYSVNTDLISSEILTRCLRVLSDVVLDDKVGAEPKHFTVVINKLFVAGTSTRTSSDRKQSFFSMDNLDDVVPQSAVTIDCDEYDADDSASETVSESNDNDEQANATLAQVTQIRSEKVFNHLIELVVGLGEKVVRSNDKFERIVEYGLAKFITLCQNRENIEVLIRMNLCSRLLLGLAPVLASSRDDSSSNEDTATSLPTTLMELVTALCSHQTSRDDFRAIIGFFKSNPVLPKESLSLVLESLHRIISLSSATISDQPSSFMTFQSGAVGSNEDAKDSTSLRFDLDINESDLFEKSEFSISFWMKKWKNPEKEHLMALGTSELLFEIVTDPSNFSVQVTSNGTLLGVATFPFAFDKKSPCWNHFVVNVSTKVVEKLAEVQVAMNTNLSRKLLIPLKGSNKQVIDDDGASESDTKVFFAPGGWQNVRESKESETKLFSLGNVFAFHGIVLDEALISIIFALGPDLKDLTISSYDYKSVFFKRLLLENPRNSLRWVMAMTDSNNTDNSALKSALTTLRQNVMLIFESGNPDVLLFFRPTRSKESGKIGVSLIESFYSVAAKSPTSLPVSPTKDLPEVLRTQQHSVADLRPSFQVERPWQFWKLIAREGGICSLLLLLARTVELECDDQTISVALDISFKVMFSHSSVCSESFHREAVLLMTRILRSEICRAGLHTVAVLFKHALTEPLIVFDEKRSIFQFRYESNAVVCDPILFEAVFDCWKMWSKDPSSIDHEKSTSCMEAVLKSCAILLRDDHPFRQFNVETFRRMGFVKKVSYVLKSDTENVETSNDSVVFQIVDLLSALVGSPPDLGVVKDLMEMALLLHETGQTFVAHSKSNFYYLLTTPDAGAPGSTTTWPRSRSFAGDFWRRAINGEPSKNGLLKHSNSYPALDESLQKEPESPEATTPVKPKPTCTEPDSMPMDEDYMFESVNVGKEVKTAVVSSSVKPVNMEKLKSTLANLKNKRERSLMARGRADPTLKTCSRKESIVKRPLFERPGPWGLVSGNDETDQVGVVPEEATWCEGSHVIEGVLNILFNAMQNLPDNLLSRTVTDIILPEYILVLCNHDCSSVRNRAVRLLWQYISRTHRIEAHGYRLLKIEGYVLLANQLHQFDATEAVVDACLSIVHNRAIILEECPEIPSHLQVSIRTPGLVPVLALMPKSVTNVALAHGLILHVHELCAKVSGLLRNYKSIGLFESLCKTLHALAHSDNRLTDVCGHDSREILFADLHDFFRLIGLRFVTAQGSENFRTVEEFLLLLLFMAWTEQETSISKMEADDGSVEKDCRKVVVAFRRSVCVVLEECLTDIEARMGQIESGTGSLGARRQSDFDMYGGNLFPLEEVTDLLLRTVSPRGSLTNEDDIGGSARRRRYRRHASSSGVSGSVTGGRSVAFWNRSPESVKLASRSEIIDRFGNVIEFAVEFLTEFDPTADPNGPDEMEENFTFSIISSLMGELYDILTAEKMNARPRTLFSSSRSLRTKLITLINYCLFPEMPFRIRVRLLRLLNNHPGCGEVLESLLRHHPEQHKLLICFIRRLVHDSRNQNDENDFEETDKEDCKSFYSSLENWDLVEPSSVEPRRSRRRRLNEDQSSSSDELDLMADDDEIIRQFSAQLANHRTTFRRRCRTLISKTLCQYDELTQQVTTKAVEVTKVAMKAQDEERKRFMVNIRDTLSEKVRARQLWQDVIEGATHERGLWHFPHAYPYNWRLDEMEGAQRIRIRMERSFSDIADRHYLEGSQPKTRKSSSMPFAYLLQAPSGMSGVIIAQLSSRDRIRHMDQCSLVLPSHEIAGEVLMSDHSIYFVENSTDETQTDGVLSITMKLTDVREYHLRWWQLTDCAVELFLSNGCTRFLVFADRLLRNNFALQLAECQPRLSVGHPDLGQITRLWQEGTLTNFDYLMQLNKLAGRTFNDLMQYPAFPFILADYTSSELDLNNPKSFRNLRKPISVQNTDNEERYINNYRALSEELSRSHELSCPSVGPYHYGSHYSNTGVVLHYLVRLPPFTSMFLKYQDGNFDLADRTFHSLESAWELASGRSSSDVKELIPDLFYLPELLVNDEGFNFGIRQNGERVDNVLLPKWASNDPRLFIKIHRQSLESDHVRETLNHWIDLVFGFKQSGPAAVDSINVFHPATYYGFDLNSISDPIQRRARATMIKTYGQTPKQLFKSPHPMVHKSFTQSPSRKGSTSSRGTPDSCSNPRVLDNISGLQWGPYVGSPSQPEPVIVWSSKQPIPVRKFVAAANNEVYGLSANSAMIVKHNREGLITPFMTTNVLGACLVTWGHEDKHLRVRLKKNCAPEPVLPLFCDNDVLTTLNICTDAVFLWIGYASGKIVAVRHTFKHRDLALELHPDQSDGLVSLYAHKGAVNEIAPCLEFGIAVSASEDSTCVIWDLRKPSYVRTVLLEDPARLVVVSRTSGDFAVISVPTRNESPSVTLSLFTINGKLVASRQCEPHVDSLTMSSSPEGIAVNVVATGHRTTGVIRLWSSWDLSPIRDIDTKLPLAAITAITFSFDNQNLYAATDQGDIVIFEKANLTGSKRPPKYLNLTEM